MGLTFDIGLLPTKIPPRWGFKVPEERHFGRNIVIDDPIATSGRHFCLTVLTERQFGMHPLGLNLTFTLNYSILSTS